MDTLYTDRLILRRFYYSDLDDLFEYAKNPNVGPDAGWKPHGSKRESLSILRQFISSDEVWAIVYKDNNRVIGSIGLHNDSKRANEKARMVGYALSEDYWGLGLATEATKAIIEYGFEKLNLDIISVYHYPHNERSKRVIEKCGFKYEGVLRRAVIIYNGNTWDHVCYSMTRDEYFSIYKRNR
ncbi:MAG: GNAT family N-acetyltransferase [Tissierellia bacterium]|nr:GNAT family N-acetyltransferase [Tissierellia bacterium]